MGKLVLTLGQLTEELSFTNDARAAAAVGAFYTGLKLGPEGATNRQKMQAFLRFIAQFTQRKAYLQHVETGRAGTEAEAAGLFKIIDDPVEPVAP